MFWRIVIFCAFVSMSAPGKAATITVFTDKTDPSQASVFTANHLHRIHGAAFADRPFDRSALKACASHNCRRESPGVLVVQVILRGFGFHSAETPAEMTINLEPKAQEVSLAHATGAPVRHIDARYRCVSSRRRRLRYPR
jgi:hypothetical protein